jgi:hypothetical protein
MGPLRLVLEEPAHDRYPPELSGLELASEVTPRRSDWLNEAPHGLTAAASPSRSIKGKATFMVDASVRCRRLIAQAGERRGRAGRRT